MPANAYIYGPKYARSSDQSSITYLSKQGANAMDGNYGNSKHSDLRLVIGAIRRAIPELSGVMIASQDGLAIAHDFPDGEAERVAAMAATALGLGKRISERTNMGELAEAVIRGENGYLVVYGAGSDAVLVMQGPIDSNLGLMRIEARVASVEIKQLLART